MATSAANAANAVEQRVLPRSLAGATVLQVVPSLRDTQQARAAIGVAHALVQAGARAIVAGESGELLEELKSFGGEWLPLARAGRSRSKRRANADALDRFIAAERVDIVHARDRATARIAAGATECNGARLVTDLPDLSRLRMRLASFHLGALGRGDRLISRSLFDAQPVMARHHIPPERIGVVPRRCDLDRFDPAKVPPEQVMKLRQAWGIPHGTRVALAPGRVAPRNGHLTLVRATRLLTERGMRGVTFVLVGDDRRHRRFARKFWREAQTQGVDALFRMVGHRDDMTAAYAASDVVVAPYLSPPTSSRVVAEAQAMARPVIATSVGAQAEHMLTPPRVADELRTGWEVPPGDAAALARAIEAALALDDAAYRAHAERTRQFAEHAFSPQRAAAAVLDVYSSLLEAQH